MTYDQYLALDRYLTDVASSLYATNKALDALDGLVRSLPIPAPPPEPKPDFTLTGEGVPPGAQRDYGSVGLVTGAGASRIFYLASRDSKRNEYRILLEAPRRARVRVRVPEAGNAPLNGSSRCIVFQVHGGDNDGNPPLLSLEYFLRQREWRVYSCAMPGRPYAMEVSVPFEFDRPLEFEYRAVWDKGNGGALDVLLDGNLSTLLGPTDHETSVKPCFCKGGLYLPSAVTDKTMSRCAILEEVRVWK